MADARQTEVASKFRFELNCPAVGLQSGWSRIGGLTDESDVYEYREGNSQSLSKKKYPGLSVFPNITAERGLMTGSGLIEWRRSIKKTCLPREAIAIVVKDCEGKPLHTQTATNAFPSKLDIGELDASTSDVVLESAEFAHEGWKEMGD